MSRVFVCFLNINMYEFKNIIIFDRILRKGGFSYTSLRVNIVYNRISNRVIKRRNVFKVFKGYMFKFILLKFIYRYIICKFRIIVSIIII